MKNLPDHTEAWKTGIVEDAFGIFSPRVWQESYLPSQNSGFSSSGILQPDPAWDRARN